MNRQQIDISKNYITIQGFMVQDLNLKGNELILYALIYGFSQTTDTEFSGSISYIMKWLDCSKPTVINLLKKLCDNDLIIKKKEFINGVPFCYYSCNMEKLSQKTEDDSDFTSGKKILPPVKNEETDDNEQVVKKLNYQSKNLTGSKETSPENDGINDKGVVKKFNHQSKNLTGGGKKTLPNNIYNNIYIDDMIDKIDITHVREKLKEQIEYSYFEQFTSSRDFSYVKSIIEIMLEVSLADSEKSPEIYGANTKLFKERISELNSTHIEYILERIKTAHDIGNIKAYIAKTVFNASSTIDAYYSEEVKKIMRGAEN